jgi:predicted Rossmann fold nucleotide-binding protein DprA/Smf involved in DNA uptake
MKITFKEMAERGKEILARQGPITYEEAKAQVDRLKKDSYLRKMEVDQIVEELKKIFTPEAMNQPRRIKIYTNAAGLDMFEEGVDNELGFERVYIGHKIPRYLKSHKWKESHTKGYFKRLKIAL